MHGMQFERQFEGYEGRAPMEKSVETGAMTRPTRFLIPASHFQNQFCETKLRHKNTSKKTGNVLNNQELKPEADFPA